MNGKTCVITGATSGIGLAAAKALAILGARIVLVARDRKRGELALAQLMTCTPGLAHAIHYADLSRLSEMKRVAADIAAMESRVDVLINNAGALYSYRQVTEDELERTFALNHMSYYVLTISLRDRLFAATPARVVNTTSAMHQRGILDFSDLQFARGYNGVSAYQRSKRCNVLFTRELARRWVSHGVTANCLHPGLVVTRFGNDSGGLVPAVFKLLKLLFGASAENGARTIIHLASSPDVAAITGGYFENCRQLPLAEDDALRLWEATAKLAAIE